MTPAPNTGAVRRMVLDPPPWWGALALVVIAVMVAATDTLRLIDPDSRSLMALAAPIYFMPSALLLATARRDVWRTLPVTDDQVALAQWWTAIGLPIAVLSLILVSAAILVSVLGSRPVDAGNAFTLLMGQMGVAAAVPAINLASTPLRRRFGVAGVIALTFGLASLLLLAFRFWRPDDPSMPIRVAGLLALVGAAVTYVRKLPFVVTHPARHFGSSASEPAPNRGRSDWFGVLLIFAPMVLALVLGALIVELGFETFYLSKYGEKAGATAGIMGRMLVMGAPIPMAFRFRMAARALSGTPISGAALALAFIAIVLTTQLAALAMTGLADWVVLGVAPPPDAHLVWILGIGACIVVPVLRLYNQVATGLVIGFATALSAPLSIPWSGQADWPPAAILALAAAGLITLLVGWGLAWREIAQGYRVWRPMPTYPNSWRGS